MHNVLPQTNGAWSNACSRERFNDTALKPQDAPRPTSSPAGSTGPWDTSHKPSQLGGLVADISWCPRAWLCDCGCPCVCVYACLLVNLHMWMAARMHEWVISRSLVYLQIFTPSCPPHECMVIGRAAYAWLIACVFMSFRGAPNYFLLASAYPPGDSWRPNVDLRNTNSANQMLCRGKLHST